MRLSDIQPKKNFSYIFVQFPGMKMNVPVLPGGERKAVKEDVALCVQLDRKKKVKDVYFVRTQSIKPFDFTDEGIGAKASYHVIKERETSFDLHMNEAEDFETMITEEVKIVQKVTETGFNFILVVNRVEVGIVASIEVRVVQIEQEALSIKEKANESVTAIADSRKNSSVSLRSAKKSIILGGHVFQDYVVSMPIRILLEGVKRKVTVFSPAALDFIGPGD